MLPESENRTGPAGNGAGTGDLLGSAIGTDSTAEARFYDALTAAGVPIFCGPDNYAGLSRWQRFTGNGNAARLAARRPGDCVMALCGGPMTVLDVDPRNGGDVQQVRGLLDELGVRIFAEVETGGLGAHFYIAGHPDVATRHGVDGWPGLDVQAAGANVFLPGSLRAKHGGRGYRIVATDLGHLVDGDPAGAERFAGWFAERAVQRDVDPVPPAAVWTGPSGVTPYLQTVLDNTIEELRDAPGGRWNDTLNTKAFKLGQFIAGAGLPEADALAALEAGCQANDSRPPDAGSVATIRSGLRAGQLHPRAVSEAAGGALRGLPAGMDARLAAAANLAVRPGPPAGAEGAADDPAPVDAPPQGETARRRLVLTAAAQIRPRPVRWVWTGRLALGTLALLAGREGLGKSTLGYWIAARVTRGELPGEYAGKPRGVLVCATEDSWEHTIVPRLLASGADLDRVFRVDVIADEVHEGLSLPRDLKALERAAAETDAALLLLDPLMSRLDGDLDTHRDGEVRRALEPLVAVADRTRMVVLGLIHHNKSGSTDPLQLVMGSKAFTAVARSVHTVVPDPDDESDTRRLFGTPKNNLGRADLPTLTFTIESHRVDTDEGPAWTGSLAWGEELAETISETMRRASDSSDDRSAASEAAGWLADYLTVNGGRAASADIRLVGGKAGHNYDALKRAKRKLKLTHEDEGFPRRTYWITAGGDQSEHSRSKFPRGDSLTALTALTGRPSVQSVQSEQSAGDGAPVAPTGAPTGRQRRSDGLDPPQLTGSDAPSDQPPSVCTVCGAPLLLRDGRTICARRDQAHEAARAAS